MEHGPEGQIDQSTRYHGNARHHRYLEMNQLLPASGALDLNRTQMKALMIIYIENAPYMSKVCYHLNMEKGSLTPVIDRLIQMNPVERRRNPEDRRRVNLRCTEVGLSLVQAALHRAHRHILEKLKTLPGEEVERFKSALSVLHEITMKL